MRLAATLTRVRMCSCCHWTPCPDRRSHSLSNTCCEKPLKAFFPSICFVCPHRYPPCLHGRVDCVHVEGLPRRHVCQKQMASAAAALAPAPPKKPSTPPKNKPVGAKIVQQLVERTITLDLLPFCDTHACLHLYLSRYFYSFLIFPNPHPLFLALQVN